MAEQKMTPKAPLGGAGGKMPVAGEKAKDFKGSLKKLVRYLAAYKGKIVLVMVFAICSTLFTIVGPKILGMATTELSSGLLGSLTGGRGIDFGYIGMILLILTGLYLVSFGFSYLQSFLMTDVSMKVTYNLRRDISKKINRMPMNYFDTTSHGEILSRVTNDIDTLSQTLNQSITQIITSTATVIGITVMMFTISWEMTLTALCIIPVSLLFISQLVKHSQKHFSAQQEYLGHINGQVEEMYGGHTVVKAFNGEDASVEEFSRMNDVLYQSAWKSQFLSGMMMPLMNFISNLGYVVVCILGGFLAVTQGLALGDIQAFIQYVRQFTQPLSQIANIANVLQQALAAAERVFEFLAEEEEVPEASDPLTDTSAISPTVEFDHVCFGYNPDKIILHDFSAKVGQGQKFAIVGPTGAGKSTVIKLLMRFYDINSGTIRIGGHDIRDFSRDSLRSMFGMVLQETWLYSGSVRENIRYGMLEASDEQVMDAAQAAQVDHFVRTLPGGYDMELNEEGSNVSQGQKQLLTIARAILCDPKILILDEATSSVDTRTELLIQKAMDNLMQGRTSFIIAHRLSTIRDADCILVMKDGDIIEMGNHDELMKKGEFYASLYNSQFAHAG